MGQKPLERKPVAGQAGVDQRGHKRRWTGQTLDRNIVLNAGPDQQKARVRNARRTRIGHQRECFSLLQLVHQPLHGLVFIEYMVAMERLADIKVAQQHPRRTGVFGQDSIRILQDFNGSQRNVVQITDGRRHEVKFHAAR